jgi:hypothetical protein
MSVYTWSRRASDRWTADAGAARASTASSTSTFIVRIKAQSRVCRRERGADSRKFGWVAKTTVYTA